MTEPAASLPPIRRTIDVPWAPEEAFRRFTGDFGRWWPRDTHSLGQDRTQAAVFECRAGGRIYERWTDGSEHPWGEVTLWEPPLRVGFLWHPGRPRETRQDVELSFSARAGGTRVTLVSWGWERWGKGAGTARRGYRLGWGYVLDRWTGRRTLRVIVLDAITAVVRRFRRPRPGG